ncbi:APC family permease [Tropicimonas sp. IMCC6043]|uniref:APC family permease n=1 Tax=Tropicimonas sp. IMCC6043 TaxID=2510645 RepID=UPI00101B8666|nr:APC family permease [Tropicimonas sp. IMCC6043]RYH06132.1 amino acid permease [Tropicimonas sp. IMCC6043]
MGTDGHVPEEAEREPRLRRAIGLWLLVLYGLGVTIGAGIYVLIGETVERAGTYAPFAFILSAVVMGFTAGSFAELSGRIPRAAGEAVYVEAAFGRAWLTLAVGGAIVVEAVVAAAAIALGSAGYVAEIIPLPGVVLVVPIIVFMTLIAAWGVRESVLVAGVMTIVEVLGLLAIIVAGFVVEPEAIQPGGARFALPTGPAALSGVMSASLLAFFAYIGFDDIVNLVEEARDPTRTVPRAIAITLAIVTLLYALVAVVAVRSVPAEVLAASEAPVSLLFERLTNLSPLGITLIAILATMNGVIIILIMAARVIYGLARKERLPAWLGAVSPRTKTPLNATLLVSAAVLVLALIAPLDRLAEVSSQVILTVFCLANLSLLRMKTRREPLPKGCVRVPALVPALGALSCLGLLIGASLGGG